MNWVWSAMLATSVGISYIRWKSRDIETPTVLPQIAADDGKEREEKEKKVSIQKCPYNKNKLIIRQYMVSLLGD